LTSIDALTYDIDQRRYTRFDDRTERRNLMNEQGIAWMIAGGTHADPSPDERRAAALRTAMARLDRPHGGLRERLAAVVTGRASGRAQAVSTDCCPA
jgi:hypothetical protein